MTNHGPSYVVAVLTVTLNHVRTSAGNCFSSNGGIRGKSFGCEDGYYCCNITSADCCPEAGSNNSSDLILVVSGMAVLLFVGVMLCYLCSGCPAYYRRTGTDTSGTSASVMPSQASELGPYIVQSVSRRDDQMPPFPQEALGVGDRYDQALVSPPSPPYREAPPYSRHPRQVVLPPYQTGDSYVSLTLPVYPDEPPPRYSP